MSSTIVDIHGRQILDSRGNPTLEVEVRLADNSFGRAAVPTGASTGVHEAWELRDKDDKQFLGKGVTKAVNNVNQKIAEELLGMDALEQALVDRTRAELGRVDFLVNNAATNPSFGAIHDMDERAFDMIMNTNVKSVHFLSNFARAAMLEHGQGGAIVNVSSTIRVEEIAVHPDILAWRERLGLDYGKLDYVEVDGRAVLFDVNKTTGTVRAERSEDLQVTRRHRAAGIESFFV